MSNTKIVVKHLEIRMTECEIVPATSFYPSVVLISNLNHVNSVNVLSITFMLFVNLLANLDPIVVIHVKCMPMVLLY